MRASTHVGWLLCVAALCWSATAEASGDRIVWNSNRSGTHSIWMMDPNGTCKTQLTDDAGNDFHPAMSPNGREIAFTSDRAGASLTLWLMSADGTDLREIAIIPDLNAHFPSWSPDGQRIAHPVIQS